MKVSEVKVYFLNIDKIATPKLFCQLISEKRKEKIKRYIFIEDKIRSLFGELLMRYAIILNSDFTNHSINFIHNKFGKPLLQNSDFSFNISHSGSYVICIIGNGNVGVDIEKHKDKFDSLVNNFHEKEQEYLITTGVEKKKVFEQWCLKESYVKYIGKGLHLPIDSFFILKNKGKIEVNGNATSPLFELLDILVGYSVAVCFSEGELKEVNEITETELRDLFKV